METARVFTGKKRDCIVRLQTKGHGVCVLCVCLHNKAQLVNAQAHNLIYISYRFSSYLKGNTSRHRYGAQPVNAVWGKQSLFIVRSI
jgi:hypothetical protein